MSTRIIIEKNGERYACDGLDIEIQNKSILYVSDGTSNAMASYVTLPPVIRTDNSEVIARLEAENAELNMTIDDNLRVAKACRDSDQDEKFELRQERSRLICENAKLREALKPIMACHEQSTSWHIDCTSAVRKEQDVINAISRKDKNISRKGGAK